MQSLVIGKGHASMNIQPLYFCHSSILLKEYNEPSLRALILNIKGVTDHFCLENCSE